MCVVDVGALFRGTGWKRVQTAKKAALTKGVSILRRPPARVVLVLFCSGSVVCIHAACQVMCLKDTTWAIRDWISSRELLDGGAHPPCLWLGKGLSQTHSGKEVVWQSLSLSVCLLAWPPILANIGEQVHTIHIREVLRPELQHAQRRIEENCCPVLWTKSKGNIYFDIYIYIILYLYFDRDDKGSWSKHEKY